MKYFILLVSVLSLGSAIAQENEKVFIVDVLIDNEARIFLEDIAIEVDNIEKEMSDYVFRKNAFYNDNVLYRIYADRNLNLGVIMDVNNQLIKAFHPSNTKTERYLLYTEELDVNAGNWQNEVQKLDLKAIEN